jgi:CRP-like cAMP-binding protein
MPFASGMQKRRVMMRQSPEQTDGTPISAIRSALEKLATFILRFLTWTGEDKELKLELHMGREDIADYLGVTVETVSRSFAKLKAQNVVSLARTQTIIIHDIGRLIALAAGGAIEDDNSAS